MSQRYAMRAAELEWLRSLAVRTGQHIRSRWYATSPLGVALKVVAIGVALYVLSRLSAFVAGAAAAVGGAA